MIGPFISLWAYESLCISQKSIDPSGNLPLDSLFQRLMVIGKDPALALGPWGKPLKKGNESTLEALDTWKIWEEHISLKLLKHVLAPFWGATWFFDFRIMVKG